VDLTPEQRDLIAKTRRALVDNPALLEQIARDARTLTPYKPPRPPRVPLTAEEQRLRTNARMRAYRASMTPEQKAAKVAYMREWRARRRGEEGVA
jgi:hypothetical protein